MVIGFMFLWAGLFEQIVAGISFLSLIDETVYISGPGFSKKDNPKIGINFNPNLTFAINLVSRKKINFNP